MLDSLWNDLFRGAVSILLFVALVSTGYLIGERFGVEAADPNWRLYGVGCGALIWSAALPKLRKSMKNDNRSR